MRNAGFDYEGPQDLRGTIAGALRWVVDPQLGFNLLDAGLVYGVRVTDEVVLVRMALSSPRSAVSDVIVEDVQAELFDHLHGGREVRVEVVSNPPWSTARMAVVPLRRRAA
jgi:metal-sulfur cluster biosynthetic enzyme